MNELHFEPARRWLYLGSLQEHFLMKYQRMSLPCGGSQQACKGKLTKISFSCRGQFRCTTLAKELKKTHKGALPLATGRNERACIEQALSWS